MFRANTDTHTHTHTLVCIFLLIDLSCQRFAIVSDQSQIQCLTGQRVHKKCLCVCINKDKTFWLCQLKIVTRGRERERFVPGILIKSALKLKPSQTSCGKNLQLT